MSEQQQTRFDDGLARLERMAGLARLFIGGIIALIGAVFALGMTYRSTLGDLENVRHDQLADRARITAIETDRATKLGEFNQLKLDCAAMKADLSWLRSYFERREK